MATARYQLAADTITDLTAELSLADGTSYLVQCLGGVMFLTEAATAPADMTGPAHVVSHLQTWTVQASSSENLYGWGSGLVVVTEAE